MQKKKVVRTKWQGKSKGNVLGYRIFVFLIKYLGIRSAYVLLIFVAFYYFLSQWKSNGYLYRYFHRRLGYSPLKAFVSVYRNYFVFGQTIIDKVAIFAQFHHQFTYEFDGVELLRSESLMWIARYIQLLRIWSALRLRSIWKEFPYGSIPLSLFL